MAKLLSSKIKIEHKIAQLLNVYRSIKFLQLKSSERTVLKESISKIKKNLSSKKCILIGNGPSVKKINFDLEEIEKADIFTCNHFYKHEHFSRISPKVHFIIDRKILTGEWDSRMIDNVLEKSPNTLIAIDLSFAKDKRLKKYRDYKNIVYIYPCFFPSFYSSITKRQSSKCMGLNVMLAALSTTVKFEYTHFAFCGIDGDGIFQEICNSSSHFYDESKKDSSMNSFNSMIESLNLHNHFIKSWQGIILKMESKGLKVYNLSNDGILNFSQRINLQKYLELR